MEKLGKILQNITIIVLNFSYSKSGKWHDVISKDFYFQPNRKESAVSRISKHLKN